MLDYEVEYIIDNEIKIDIITLEDFYSDCISDFISDKIREMEGNNDFEILNYREIRDSNINIEDICNENCEYNNYGSRKGYNRCDYEKDILFNKINTN